MSRIRLAVIGAGAIGRKHIDVITQVPQVELAAIADPSPQAEALAKSLGVAWYADVDTMLDQLVAPIVYRILYGLQPDVAFGRKLVEQLVPEQV